MNSKLLIITNYNGMWPFAQDLSNELINNGIIVDILDYGKYEFINYNTSKYSKINNGLDFLNKIPIIKKIYRNILLQFFIKTKIKSLKSSYNTTLVLFHSYFLNKFAVQIKKSCKILAISYAGSDFYRINSKTKEDNKTLLNYADIITFNNVQMKNDFIDYYNDYTNKTKITGFGLKVIDVIEQILLAETISTSKTKLGIHKDSFVISIGYNASSEQQHLLAINELIKIKSILPENYLIVFPFTYNNNKLNYKEELDDILQTNDLNYLFLTDELSFTDVARLRIITNIAVNLQTTDQASAALLEHLYAKNIVIVGKWLPYNFWDDLGLFSFKINTDELSYKIEYCITHYNEIKKKCEINSDLIRSAWSWESRINNWINAFEL